MALLNHASVAHTHLQWKSLIFHAARPVYTDNVFLKPFKATINVFTARKFWILKILLIVLLNARHCQEANVAQTTTLTEVKVPPEANMSGEANVSQTTTVPELKAPPEANVSQKEISANMNPPNILGEPPAQDEDMNPHEQPVVGEERSLSGMSTFGKNNHNGLLFAPTCTTCFKENKYHSTSKKSVPTNGIMSALIALESTFFFPQGCFIVDTTMTNPTQFSYKHNYSVPQPCTPVSYDSHDP
jgi:hypothetical protein